ncbi:adenosylcobinamide-GDP ribazoletransferase [Streptomyces sp. ACA25]|uniref:adenosylcobinamide-GDP ribazoletransferase n=1 Tax=Streptomyces sp. ACA25 TaxID=3022596 RepID=UPI002306EC84|nr:adenosylcobinamide-GDP ribazoletransferase [Streptomyces sp. ACA25]MDB1089948.1 adenosylcobinamide-GDP ribazoletransferase [Streptomyces sp. ACA25]
MNDTPPPSSTGPAPVTRTAAVADGLRFAFGTLTVLPVRVRRWDRTTARAGMLCAPLAGLVVGLGAAAGGCLLLALGSGPLLAAVATAAVPAALTRGLHWDGLADVADGLGSGKPADAALRIMKQSDIGPFGVLTLVFVLLAQVAALHGLYTHGWAHGAAGAVVAGLAARTALTRSCRRGIPAARRDGLGAVVAQTVPGGAAVAVTAAAVTAGAGVAVLGGGPALPGAASAAVLGGVTVVAALGAAELLLRHCRRRFGGVTGDVLGAVAETAGTVALLVLTLGAH